MQWYVFLFFLFSQEKRLKFRFEMVIFGLISQFEMLQDYHRRFEKHWLQMEIKNIDFVILILDYCVRCVIIVHM